MRKSFWEKLKSAWFDTMVFDLGFVAIGLICIGDKAHWFGLSLWLGNILYWTGKIWFWGSFILNLLGEFMPRTEAKK